MCTVFAHAAPAEFVIAPEAIHMRAASVLLNADLARRALAYIT